MTLNFITYNFEPHRPRQAIPSHQISGSLLTVERKTDFAVVVRRHAHSRPTAVPGPKLVGKKLSCSKNHKGCTSDSDGGSVFFTKARLGSASNTVQQRRTMMQAVKNSAGRSAARSDCHRAPHLAAWHARTFDCICLIYSAKIPRREIGQHRIRGLLRRRTVCS